MSNREVPSLLYLSNQIAGRQISPTEIVESCLSRIAAKEPEVLAWKFLAQDHARREAARRTEELANGSPRSPLHGIPFGVKDIFDTAGMPTAWGSPLYAGRVPSRDSELVARLQKMGAIVLGKTHTTAFASFDPAPTRNPWNGEHSPGGSSSGSAAAVALGMVPFALGSQTLGSVLRPASFCGVVGFKPTFDALPPGGMLPFAPTLDHAGLFTQTVEDMAWLWPIVSGASALSAAPHRQLASPKWPIVGDLEPEMAQGFENALRTLAGAGFEIRPLKLPESLLQVPEAVMIVNQYEGAQTHKVRFEEYGPRMGAKLAALIEEGLRTDPATYKQALAQISQAREDFAVLTEQHPVWVTPSALGAAPKGLATTGDPRANAPFTALGVPAISLPFGRSPSGLPLGLQLAAAKGAEAALLATAMECEKALSSEPATKPIKAL